MGIKVDLLSARAALSACRAHAPFDVIHVGAAASEIPRALLAQLKVGGRMIVPVGPEGGAQDLVQVR